MSESPAGTIDWEALTSFSDTFTCYSAAIATWVAGSRDDWPRVVNPGLWLTLVTDVPDGRFGFVHFAPGLRSALGLERTGSDTEAAVPGVLEELSASGRVIVAGDGFNLPWHVAYGRRHAPHWYVLGGPPEAPTVLDPFACRNELGTQAAWREPLAADLLPRVLLSLPGDDPVALLRERLALGDDAGTPAQQHRCQWFTRREVDQHRAPSGLGGPEAIRRLAVHFRERGRDPDAYAQADDIWSIARHRAFLCRYGQALAERDADEQIRTWVQEHGGPLAKRWGHMAPLMMQATLALSAGRAPSASVPDTLDELAERERAADQALPAALDAASI